MSNVGYFDTVDPANFSGLEFLAYGDSPLRILASSELGDTWDLYFGLGDPASPDLVFENLAAGPLAGSVFTYDPLTGAYEIVGSFSADLTDVMTLSGDDQLVPEPHTMALLGCSASCWLLRRRRVSDRTVG